MDARPDFGTTRRFKRYVRGLPKLPQPEGLSLEQSSSKKDVKTYSTSCISADPVIASPEGTSLGADKGAKLPQSPLTLEASTSGSEPRARARARTSSAVVEKVLQFQDMLTVDSADSAQIDGRPFCSPIVPLAPPMPSPRGRPKTTPAQIRASHRPSLRGARMSTCVSASFQRAASAPCSPAARSKDATVDVDKLLRAQEQLSGLLDALGDATDSNKWRVSEASTKSFNRFMKGYARNAGTNSRRQSSETLKAVVGEVHVDRSDSPSTRNIGDHYHYFTHIPRDDINTHCHEAHASRLERSKMLLIRQRSIMNSMKKSKDKVKQRGKHEDADHTPDDFPPGMPDPDALPERQLSASFPRCPYPSNSNASEPESPTNDKGAAARQRDLLSRRVTFKIGEAVDLLTLANPVARLSGGHSEGLTKWGDHPVTPKGKGKDTTPRSSQSKREESPGSPRFQASSAAATAALKAEMRTREACESLRFLVFGTQTYSRKQEGGAFYEQRCGKQQEIVKLFSVWNQMDEDGSGDVEFQEFLSFFSRSKADRLLGMRCVKYLVGNLKEQEDEDEPDGCRIEDMMRLIWLKATQDDIKQMMQWFREAEFRHDLAPTPPLLPKRKRREVLENFPAIDKGGQEISFEDLVDSGLVDESTAKDFRQQYDRSNSNRIDENLLLEMLCPNGYRAHPTVKTCADSEGQPLVHVENGFFTGWVAAAKAFKWDLAAASNRETENKLYRGTTIFDLIS